MTLDEALMVWQSKPRRMGCNAATLWLCKRVQGYKPVRLSRYTPRGEYFEHVVATNGVIRIDLAPYSDPIDQWLKAKVKRSD